MKIKLILIWVVLSIITVILYSCSSISYLNKLTLVDDPFEFQNPYFPIELEYQWSYDIRTQNAIGNLVPNGTLEFKVKDYIFDDFYLGDSLVYAPFYRLDGVFRNISGEVNEAESYALKTNQGIVLVDDIPEDSTLNIFRFIPNSEEYFHYFPELYDISFAETDFTSSNTVIVMIERAFGAEKIYYEKNIGLVKMIHERYDKKRFSYIIENDYTLTEYKVK